MMAHVTVIICHYLRARGLQRLLQSLASLEEAPIGFRCLIVDNNPTEQPLGGLAHFPFEVEVVRENRPGIPWARNTGMRKALAEPRCEFLAFLDDDEEVSPRWLRALLEVQERTGAEVVTGPVIPKFEENPPEWGEEAGLFESERYDTGSVVPVAYSGNVLVKSAALRTARLSFDPEFKRGEDSLFFRQLVRLGNTIVWAQDAEVWEWHPPERTRVGWLLNREFIQGYIRAKIDLHFEPGLVTRIKSCVRAFTRVVTGTILTLRYLPASAGGVIRGLRRFAAGSGRFWAALGLPYRLRYETGVGLER